MRSASRSLALWLSLFLFWGLVFWGVWQLLTNPDAGLPREWNPLEPLHISDPVTPVTGLKLRRTANNGPACLSALETGSVITGFQFEDGRRLRLIDDWDGGGAEAEFLRQARDGACTWFATTLGPDYNALHADHFHLQSRGWGTCN